VGALGLAAWLPSHLLLGQHGDDEDWSGSRVAAVAIVIVGFLLDVVTSSK